MARLSRCCAELCGAEREERRAHPPTKTNCPSHIRNSDPMGMLARDLEQNGNDCHEKTQTPLATSPLLGVNQSRHWVGSKDWKVRSQIGYDRTGRVEATSKFAPLQGQNQQASLAAMTGPFVSGFMRPQTTGKQTRSCFDFWRGSSESPKRNSRSCADKNPETSPSGFGT